MPDALARSGGDLCAAIFSVAVNAWMAGHIHGTMAAAGAKEAATLGARLGGAHARDLRDAAGHHQVVRPGHMDRTKGELAGRLVLRAVAADLSLAWLAADVAYGQEGRLRRLLEQFGFGYVLAVPKSQQVIARAPEPATRQHFAPPRDDGAKGQDPD